MLGGALSVGTAGLAAGWDPSTLEGRLAAAQAQEGELHAGIGGTADRSPAFRAGSRTCARG